MAQKVVTILVDDLDGTDLEEGAGETVTFMLDGQAYEIDLSAENASHLREGLSGYVAAGRRIDGKRTARGAAGRRGARSRRS